MTPPFNWICLLQDLDFIRRSNNRSKLCTQRCQHCLSFSCCTWWWRSSIYLSAHRQNKTSVRIKEETHLGRKLEFPWFVLNLLHWGCALFNHNSNCHKVNTTLTYIYTHPKVREQHYHLETCFWQIFTLFSLCFLKEMSNSLVTTFTCLSLIVSVCRCSMLSRYNKSENKAMRTVRVVHLWTASQSFIKSRGAADWDDHFLLAHHIDRLLSRSHLRHFIDIYIYRYRHFIKNTDYICFKLLPGKVFYWFLL